MTAEDVLRKVRTFLHETPLESGVCMCGDDIKYHGIGSGHSPVDELTYYVGGLIEDIDKVLGDQR